MRSVVAAFCLLFASTSLIAAQSPSDPAHGDWHSYWITHPTAPLREPIVLHFRRAVTFESVPAHYPVRVSADNRFILYVNGQRVGDGPARSDLAHWRYELFDLAPYLRPGQNLVTATVWNYGIQAPIAQFSDRTAFLLESDDTGPTGISTGKDWLVEDEPGRQILDRSTVTFQTYTASGPGEEIDAAHYDWDWDAAKPGPRWVPAASPMRESMFSDTNRARSADSTADNPWALVPDALPHMEFATTSAGQIVSLDSIGEEQPGLAHFPEKDALLPPGIHTHILLDRKTLTTAYPHLVVSGGKGAKIILTYSEALYDKDGHKGDRDEVANRVARGITDRFLPDGGQHRVFEPLWWRTWRYLDLDITTGDSPLTLDSLTANFTAYPFEEKAHFDSPDPDLAKIWEISWRTARLDAHETYMDTPYYEQLQYVGDTRIQALISYSVAGDDRLARQALEAFNDSRSPDGLTRSRYPSSLPQTIPTFSLIWIGMVHDWWMYRPDPAPVREALPGIRDVLGFFANYEQPDGLLHKVPWWSFVDWVNSGDIPSYDANGESCIVTLHYLGALDQAADLEHALGDPVQSQRDRERASHVRSAIYSKCWNPTRGLLADNPDQKVFSQQANALAVLYDVIPAADRSAVLKRVFSIQPGETPDGVMSASYYFRFYLARALDHAGMADSYLDSLKAWRDLLPLHFSTWPEQPGETRSDSHAWSAHPAYDLLTLVAGIQPAAPGFSAVRIAPHLGSLPNAKASFPHPAGLITVDYKRHGATLDADITLPPGLSGTFVYGGREQPLHPGANHLTANGPPIP
jgi:hypothetical protein